MSGHSFCQRCITREVDVRKKCPICRAPLSHFELSPNDNVRKEIDSLKVYCKYGIIKDPTLPGMWKTDPNGCSIQINFNEKEEHEKNCAHRINKT